MKQTVLKLFLIVLFLPTFFSQGKTIRVACVGNSITYGAGIANRDKNSYPAQLQYYLGEGYEVKNFGVSATTLLSKGDYPYITTNEYKESKSFNPDIVLIKLGTNDSKPQNWKFKDNFKENYNSLIESYRNLPSKPRIIILTPVRCFLAPESNIKAELISKDIRQMVEDVAWENKLDIINLFNIFGDKWDEALLPDKLHPSSIGAGIMAKKISSYLLSINSNQKADTNIDGKPFNFHGHQGYDFTIDGINCKIVVPKNEAKGKPWVLRARFWGHEPQTDIDLLEKGFHIAYCDVADLYGSNKAVKRWNSFYKYMTKLGFNKKVVLEGMSRGGLIVYNWAARNPEKVACIYADAPVMDIKSWPMGKGKSEGSAADTKLMMEAYGFSNTDEAIKWEKNPLNHASIMAKHNIPIIHVVGDIDETVPVDENTGIFVDEMKKYGKDILVIHKPNVGHHPHSLNNPEPIVDFILNSMNMHINYCTIAVPGNEFRSAAGWAEDSEWHSVSQDIENSLENRKLDLLLLGNSITQGWGGNRKAVTYKPGKAAMDKMFGENRWETAGISGDRTQNLLWRIRHCNYNRCQPKVVMIAIGINNLVSGQNSVEDTAEGIIAVSKEAVSQFPDSRIILLGLFPSGKEKDSEVRKKCDKIHSILGETPVDGVEYINPSQWFLDKDGNIDDAFYSKDYIHFTDKGYQLVAEKLRDIIQGS